MLTGHFPSRRSAAACTPSRATEAEAEAEAVRVAALVALTTRLADRMEAMPSAGPARDSERRARVRVLRDAAEAGNRTLLQRAARER